MRNSAGRDLPNVTLPALARVYDYVKLAERVLGIIPGYRDFARANRTFLRCAVQRMIAAGVDQFLDLGSGMLSGVPLHEVAHSYAQHVAMRDALVKAGQQYGLTEELIEAGFTDLATK